MSETDPVEYLKKNFCQIDKWKDVLAGKYFLQTVNGERAFVFEGEWYRGNATEDEYSLLKNMNFVFSMFLNPTVALYEFSYEKVLEEVIKKSNEGFTLYDTVDDCYYPIVCGRIHSYIASKTQGRGTKELSLSDYANFFYGWCAYEDRFEYVPSKSIG